LNFPNLEIVRAKDLKEIGLKTARMMEALSIDATVAVSGGTTYRRILGVWQEVLGPVPVRLFPVDERVVPFDSPQSNWGMIQQLLLDPLNWPLSKRCFVERMDEHAAEDYEKLLRSVFAPPMPQFDLIFLGVGIDGHIASLFPGSRDLDDDKSWVLRTQGPTPLNDRITLGIGVICRARQVVIIMAGREKRPVVQEMLKGDEDFPIGRVLNHPVNKLLFLDQDAAVE
jgi:6-phosphogluconolactonase